jgi:hypothetical protein
MEAVRTCETSDQFLPEYKTQLPRRQPSSSPIHTGARPFSSILQTTRSGVDPPLQNISVLQSGTDRFDRNTGIRTLPDIKIPELPSLRVTATVKVNLKTGNLTNLHTSKLIHIFSFLMKFTSSGADKISHQNGPLRMRKHTYTHKHAHTHARMQTQWNSFPHTTMKLT